MSYYCVMIKKYNDATADKVAIYSYATLDEARASAHTNYGQNLGGATIHSILCLAINSAGGIYDNLYWAEASEEPEA